MNPNDDDRYYNDDSDLFPNAGQRVSSHNFYSSDPIAPPQQQLQYQQAESEELDEYCPRCDARLEVRESTLGKYIACTRFPDCRYTQPFAESNSVGYENSNNATSASNASEANIADTEYNSGEKDYLQEAAEELAHSQQTYSEQYDEPDEQPENNYSEQYSESHTDNEQPTGLPPEPYYVDEEPAAEQEPEQEISLEPKLYPLPSEQSNSAEESVEKTHETPLPEYHKDRSILLSHPGFLNKKSVSESAKWSELKQKRLLDQKRAALSPAEVAAQENMTSPEELAETLKKLEEDVQKLQQSEADQLSPHTEEPSAGPRYDEYDDDVLPPSLRQALREKSPDDY